jgi:2',3'-cyclic-nucleotide 2'-phosphodiesterase/3'-nucleotidase
METTDIHVACLPYDYYGDRPNDTIGLAAPHRSDRRIPGESTNSMLLDNGDFLQGNPMGDYIAYERGMSEGDIPPDHRGHERARLRRGDARQPRVQLRPRSFMEQGRRRELPDGLRQCLDQDGRLATRATTTLVPPYVILDRTVTDGAGESHPIRVGIIGFVPPQIMTWDRRHLRQRAGDATSSRRRRPGCRRCARKAPTSSSRCRHSGIGAADQTDMMENASLSRWRRRRHRRRPHRPPAPRLPRARLRRHRQASTTEAGHADGQARPSWPASGARHMGLVDLMLERDGNTWKVVDPTCPRRGRSTSAGGPQGHRAGRATKRFWRCVEASTRPRSPMSAPRSANLAPLIPTSPLSPTTRRCRSSANAQTWYVEQMMADGEYEGLPVLSAAAPFKAGGRGGPEYYTDVAGRLGRHQERGRPLPLSQHGARGAHHRGRGAEWLEMSAGMFNQIDARQGRRGPDQPRLSRPTIST